MSIHREIIQDMKALDAIDYLLRVIERRALTEADVCDGMGIHLSGTKHSILSLLMAAGGRTVNKFAIYDHLYSDRPKEEQPDYKSVDVHICQLRKLLNDTDYSIKTMHGRGYRLVKNSETSDCGADNTPTPQTTPC